MAEKRVTQQTASDEIYSDDWFLKDSVNHGTTKIQPSVMKTYFNQGMATSQDVTDEATARTNADNQLASGIGKQMNNLADFYSTTKSYVVGDVAILQSGELMRCTSPTSGSFNPSKWEQITVDELFDDLNFSADAISYDNTSSGLEADNVQDAIDETITKLSAVGSASGDIATFDDGSDLSMPKCEVAIEPVQDLHGYDAPWVGGSGKNKLQITATTQTLNGVTFTVNSDGTVSLSGTATGTFVFPLISGTLSFTSDTIITGGYAEASVSKVALRINGSNLVPSEGYTISANTNITELSIRVNSGFNTNGIKVYPMIRLASVADATFAPYSNICPISGWDEVNVVDAGKNIYNDSIVWKNGYYINASGNETQSNNYKYIQTYIEVEPSTTYSIQADIIAETDLAITVPYYTEAQSFISRDIVSSVDAGQRTYKADFTTPSNCKYIRMSVPADTTNIIIYKKNTYTIDLDGTRYGGKVDLVSGVLTVDRAIVTFDGSSDETISEYSASSYRYRLWISEYRAVAESVLDTKLICSKLKTYTKNNLASDSSILYGLSPSDISSAYIIVKANGITNLADFKTWLSQNELQVVYPLATPLTIQLTPTVVKSLRGVNNVFADSGEILDAEYIRDMTTVLEETEILNKNILVLNKQAKVPNNGTYTNTYTATKDCYVLAYNQCVHEEASTHTVTATFSSTGTQIATSFVENNSWSSPNRVHATRLSAYKLKSGQTITFTNTCQSTSNARAFHFAVMIDERLASKISSITNLKSYVKSDNALQDVLNDEEITASGLYLAVATSRTNSGASEASIECFTDGVSAVKTVHKYWEYAGAFALFTVDKQATVSMMFYRTGSYAHCGYQIYRMG